MRLRFKYRLAIIGLFLSLQSTAMAEALLDGDLDPSFGQAGVVLHQRSIGTSVTANIPLGAMGVRSDRKVWWTMHDAEGGVLLGRFNADGSVDPGFATNGRLRLTSCLSVDSNLALWVDADDGVLLWTGRCLMRRNPDGSPDHGFADNGVRDVATLGGGRLARDGNGRIVLTGNAGHLEWRVHRFLHNGQPDLEFATDGVAIPNISSDQFSRFVFALALRTDGSMVIGGTHGTSAETNLILFGLSSDGSIDTAFGVAGLLEVTPPIGFNSLNAQALLTVGDDVWVAGEAHNSSQSCCVLLARYDRHGQLDANSGMRIFTLRDALNDINLSARFESRTTLAPAPHGGVWLGRSSASAPGNHRTQFTLVRLRRDGSLENNFGGAGWRSWFVNNPVTGNADGDYLMLHDVLLGEGRALMFGRLFFEDAGVLEDHVSLMQVRFDSLSADGFEP